MKKALAILLALSLFLTLPVCSGTAAAVSVEAEDAPPAGGYKLTGIAGGEGSDLEIVSAVIKLGVNYYLFLQEDGSGCMRFMEAEIPLSWDEESIIIPPRGKIPESLELPCTYEDGVLSIQTLAYSMDFTPMTDEEQAQYGVGDKHQDLVA